MVKKFWICLDKKIQDHKKYKVLMVACLMLLVFSVYLAFNIQFRGPVYMSDEVAYLTKAIALSGGSVDSASSWYGGYSMLILPAFLLFHDPDIQWKAVLVINAFMWAVSAGLLYYVLRRCFTKKSGLVISLAVLLSFAYPSFISMSGYAFATTGFVFISMLALAALMKSNLKDKRYLILFSILAGFLYWIHPLGISVVIVSLLLFILKSVLDRHFVKYLPFMVILVAAPILYVIIVHPWFNKIMTPSGLSVSDHYAIAFKNISSNITQLSFWVNFFAFIFGQIAYLFISTFGILAFGICWLFSDFGRGSKNWLKKIVNDTPKAVPTLAVVSIFVCIVIGSFFFASVPDRQDLWIYGRYSEMFILPILGVGLLVKWKIKTVIRVVVMVAVTGLLLLLVANDQSGYIETLNLVNIQSFWPLVFPQITNFLPWFIVGCVGIVLVGWIGGSSNKKWLPLILAPLIILTINIQTSFHLSMSMGYSDYIALSRVVVNNYKKDTCVGLDNVDNKIYSQFKFYTYYLQELHVTRMTFNEWLSSCDGPYLTYNSELINSAKNLKVLAKESGTGFYFLVKDKDFDFNKLPNSNMLVYYGDDIYEGCTRNGCLEWYASSKDMSRTMVGEYKNDSLYTTGREGYLFYGSKAKLTKGLYSINLKGDFLHSDHLTRLKITSGGDSENHLNVLLSKESNNCDYMFKLKEAVSDLEIKMYVGKDANISLDSYNVTRKSIIEDM